MSKIIFMKGLPGSGKSTKAKEIMEQSGNFVRLNRDLLRLMLHFNKWTGKNEGITKDVQRNIAKILLEKGINVIIDDTNLGEGHLQSWKSLAEETNSKFQVEDLTKNINIKELFKRDSEREKLVGRHVIVSMAMQYGLISPKNFGILGKWIICDIDGTIAEISHRLHFVKKTCADCGHLLDGQNCVAGGVHDKKDWKSFFAEMMDDDVRTDIRDMILDYKEKGYSIIFVSGRPDNYRDETKYWLTYTAFKDIKFVEGEDYATILMRRAGDRRSDNETKKDILETYFNKNDIELVIDDRPRVIKMWREQNLKVMDVGQDIDF